MTSATCAQKLGTILEHLIVDKSALPPKDQRTGVCYTYAHLVNASGVGHQALRVLFHQSAIFTNPVGGTELTSSYMLSSADISFMRNANGQTFGSY